MSALEALLVAVAVAVGVLVVFRLQLLRRGGTPVVVRFLPAADGRGWRHAVLRYGESSLELYRIVSVRPGPDRRVSRRRLVVADRRRAHPAERESVPPGSTVLRLDDGRGETEVALSGGELTAFLSWLESSPPRRQARRRGTR